MPVFDCSCSGDIIPNLVQCRTCGCTYTCDDEWKLWSHLHCSPANVTNITQKRIWNTVRVPASEYTMNLGSLSVYQPAINKMQYTTV